MRLTAFSSIGGLRILGQKKDTTFLSLRIPRRDISHLAEAFISEIGTEASPELIARCRELVETVDEDTASQPGLGKFVRWCEDTLATSRNDSETDQQYFDRLRDTYGSDYARRRRE